VDPLVLILKVCSLESLENTGAHGYCILKVNILLVFIPRSVFMKTYPGSQEFDKYKRIEKLG